MLSIPHSILSTQHDNVCMSLMPRMMSVIYLNISVIDLDCLVDTRYIQYFHNTVKYSIKQEVAKVTLAGCTRGTVSERLKYI